MPTKPGCYNFYTKAQEAQKAENIPLLRRRIKRLRVLEIGGMKQLVALNEGMDNIN